MSWDELVDRLYGLRRFGIEPGLQRINAVLQRHGRPQQAYRVINVAGTNGKGTVASLIGAALQAQGLRVGLYTSPHLMSIRERFRVDGRPLGRGQVGPVLEQLLDAYGPEAVGQQPALTFFEFTTVAAVQLFAQAAVDVAVFEVGLGGRFDAVNAIEPDVSVITTIGRDHTEYLGETIEEIAAEKAGILREGTPAVLGPQEHIGAREELTRRAVECAAPVWCVEAADRAEAADQLGARHRATARSAAEALLGDGFDPEAFTRGVEAWRWPGRFEEFRRDDMDRTVVLDAAHNPAGLAALREWIAARNKTISGVVWGALGDKEPGEIEAFFDVVGAPVWGALLESGRARSEDELRGRVPDELWQSAAPTGAVFQRAQDSVDGDLLVFGSVYLVGEIYEALGRSTDSLVTYCAPAAH